MGSQILEFLKHQKCVLSYPQTTILAAIGKLIQILKEIAPCVCGEGGGSLITVFFLEHLQGTHLSLTLFGLNLAVH